MFISVLGGASGDAQRDVGFLLQLVDRFPLGRARLHLVQHLLDFLLDMPVFGPAWPAGLDCF